MKHTHKKQLLQTTLITLSSIAASAPALAQEKIDGERKWSWAENVGWMNWRDAGPHGVRVNDGFLSGWIWAENVGWISLGDGTPDAAGGTQYGNTSGADHGVNMATDGTLSGFAWGENIGWINFSMFAELGSTNKHARLDPATRRFRGYAWSENVGWINLDDNGNFVALRCRADYNDDGISDILDFLNFLDDFAACTNQPMPCGTYGDPDLATDALVDILDFLDFMQIFGEGCA